MSRIDNGGVFGAALMAQNYNGYTKLSAHFEGLEDVPGNSYGLYILDYPVNYNTKTPCEHLGETYDPDNNIAILDVAKLIIHSVLLDIYQPGKVALIPLTVSLALVDISTFLCLDRKVLLDVAYSNQKA